MAPKYKKDLDAAIQKTKAASQLTGDGKGRRWGGGEEKGLKKMFLTYLKEPSIRRPPLGHVQKSRNRPSSPSTCVQKKKIN